MAPAVQGLRDAARGLRGNGHPGRNPPHAPPPRPSQSQAIARPITFKTGSKTTLAVGIGTELALDGYTVVVLDADLNQHATIFGEKASASVPNFKVIGEVNEQNILQRMREIHGQADMVMIDLPGGSSMVAVKALTKNHFVL